MPVMTGGGGLFGGDALKDNEVSAPVKNTAKQGGGNSRLKNIFDDEDEDDTFEEVKTPAQPMGGSKPTGFGGKSGGGLFSIDDDEDEKPSFMSSKPSGGF